MCRCGRHLEPALRNVAANVSYFQWAQSCLAQLLQRAPTQKKTQLYSDSAIQQVESRSLSLRWRTCSKARSGRELDLVWEYVLEVLCLSSVLDNFIYFRICLLIDHFQRSVIFYLISVSTLVSPPKHVHPAVNFPGIRFRSMKNIAANSIQISFKPLKSKQEFAENPGGAFD